MDTRECRSSRRRRWRAWCRRWCARSPKAASTRSSSQRPLHERDRPLGRDHGNRQRAARGNDRLPVQLLGCAPTRRARCVPQRRCRAARDIGETSAVMAVDESIVDLAHAVREYPAFPIEPTPAMVSAHFFSGRRTLPRASRSGVWDDPTGSTAELGQIPRPDRRGDGPLRGERGEDVPGVPGAWAVTEEQVAALAARVGFPLPPERHGAVADLLESMTRRRRRDAARARGRGAGDGLRAGLALVTAADAQPWELRLVDAAGLIAAGHLAPSELVSSALERLEAVEPVLHAFVLVDVDGAMREAREQDSRRGGPLRGIPIAIKDIFDVAGMPTGNG